MEIYIHLLTEEWIDYDVMTPINLPAVPKKGDYVYLTEHSKQELIDLINKQTGYPMYWKYKLNPDSDKISLDCVNKVKRVIFDDDGSVHVVLK